MIDENQQNFGFAERWWEKYIMTYKSDISQHEIDSFRYMFQASLNASKTEFRTLIIEDEIQNSGS
jgi:hypothetical protein